MRDEEAFEGKCLTAGLQAALRASPGPRDAKSDFERAVIMLCDGPERLESRWHDRARAYRPQHYWPEGGPVVHEGQRAAYAVSKLFDDGFNWADVPDGSRAAVRSLIDRLTDWGRGLLDQAAIMRQIAQERMAAWRVVQVERVEWSAGLPTIHGKNYLTKEPAVARLASAGELAEHLVNRNKFPTEAVRKRVSAETFEINRALTLRDVAVGETLRTVASKLVNGEFIVSDFIPVDPQMLPRPSVAPAPEQPTPQAPRAAPRTTPYNSR